MSSLSTNISYARDIKLIVSWRQKSPLVIRFQSSYQGSCRFQATKSALLFSVNGIPYLKVYYVHYSPSLRGVPLSRIHAVLSKYGSKKQLKNSNNQSFCSLAMDC